MESEGVMIIDVTVPPPEFPVDWPPEFPVDWVPESRSTGLLRRKAQLLLTSY